MKAVGDELLTVHEVDGGYRVELPAFQYMALVVVTDAGSPKDAPGLAPRFAMRDLSDVGFEPLQDQRVARRVTRQASAIACQMPTSR